MESYQSGKGPWDEKLTKGLLEWARFARRNNVFCMSNAVETTERYQLELWAAFGRPLTNGQTAG